VKQSFYLCEPKAVDINFCNQTQIGEYLLAANATQLSKNPLATVAIPLNDPKPLKYEIKNTGYYCIATQIASGESDYEAVIELRNSYGELAAAQMPKLSFYGIMTLVYAVIGMYWGFLYAQNRHDILPVQNYITAIIGFLVVEMLITWGYYDFENVHGATGGTKAFLIIVAILNAARNAFSFFLLLIVCMGYGVVKPTLGKTMIYIRALALVHFVFCIVYTIASMVIHPEQAGALVLVIILPLSTTLTIFYVWTLNSLNLTIKDLVGRKQHIKAAMYQKLWVCILITIFVIFAFFGFNSFSFTRVNDDDFAPANWQTRWFILDGWLNIVYLADVAFISYLWRPTPNNRRFAMSDEVSNSNLVQFFLTADRFLKMMMDSRSIALPIPWETATSKTTLESTNTLLPTVDIAVQERLMDNSLLLAVCQITEIFHHFLHHVLRDLRVYQRRL